MDLPTKCHLLSLPRELRNHIYEYLHHEITFRWPCVTCDQWYFTDYHLTIINAPILGVLMTNSWLNTEYREAACFTDAIITGEILPQAINACSNLKNYGTEQMFKACLKNVQRATFYLELHHGKAYPTWISGHVSKITQSLKKAMSKVKVLRIAVRQLRQGKIKSQHLESYMQACLGRMQKRLHSPTERIVIWRLPHWLSDLDPCQRGICDFFDFDDCPNCDTLSHQPSHTASSTTPDTRIAFNHACSSITFGVFAHAMEEKDAWHQKEISDAWPIKQRNRVIGQDLDTEKQASAAKRWDGIQDWNEMRRDELVEWQKTRQEDRDSEWATLI